LKTPDRGDIGDLDDLSDGDCTHPGSETAERYDWPSQARPVQLPPDSFSTWAYIAGRGAGKSKSASEYVRASATARVEHIAVVGRTFSDVRDNCFEHHKSGLLTVIPPEQVADYRKSLAAAVS
jgi:phage terminase large subunit-like protein